MISRRILTLLHSETWPDVIKLFMLNLSMEYVPVMNFKMPTIVGILKLMTGQTTFSAVQSKNIASFDGILIFMKITIFMLKRVEHKKVL